MEKLNDEMFDDIVMGRAPKETGVKQEVVNQLDKMHLGGAHADELHDGQLVRGHQQQPEPAQSVVNPSVHGSFAFSSTGVQQSTYVGTVNHKTAMDKLLREAQEWEVKSSSNRGPVSAAESQYSSDKNDFNESLLDGTTGSQAAAMEPPVIVPPVIEEEEPLEPLGLIVNPDGKPQVAHDDPYLGPFIDDLYLRQNEYKK